MTCIAAVVHNNSVVMGGDSCVSEDGGTRAMCPSKIFKAGAFMIGYAGSTEYCTLLQHRLKWPTQVEDLELYMRVHLPDYMRETCKRIGMEMPDGASLIAVAGTLWAFDDATADPVVEGYGTIGSGHAIALGALYATAGRAPRKRVQLALEAAARHRVDVSAPFNFLEQKRGT